jgi:hypothetical protein
MSEYRKSLILKDSKISGTGLFANEDIKQGSVIMMWGLRAFVISENDYNEAQKAGNELMIKTGCRFVDGIFLYTDNSPRLENYVNHSFQPNMLYHCGICFAKSNISKGDELTADYRYILAKNDANAFVDQVSGESVDGLDSQTCLTQTTKELLELLKTENYIILLSN